MRAADFLTRLDRVKKTGPSRRIAHCPAHGDRSPSLSVRELDDGRVLVHDFAGCPTEKVLGAVDLGFDALFPTRPLGNTKKVRHPFPSADVLRAVADELSVIAIIASDIEKGCPVTREDRARLRVAIERILAAKEIALGG